MRRFFSRVLKHYNFPFLLLFFTTGVNAQTFFDTKKIISNTFISDKLDYLEFINDSTLNTSLGFFNDTATYYFKGDSLTANRYKKCSNRTNVGCWSKYYSAKLILIRNDSIVLVNPCLLDKKPKDWEDTLVFVNLELLKEPIVDFKYLIYGFESWGGIDRLIIDSSGKATFLRMPVERFPPDSVKQLYNKQKKISERLSTTELAKFKTILAKSLLSKLPLTWPCAIDDLPFTFEILIGDQTYKNKGCYLSWVHRFLLDYVEIKKQELMKKMGKKLWEK